MDNIVRKKLKILLWAFFIISIPAGFFIYSAILSDKAYKAYEEATLANENEKFVFALNEISKAEQFAFYDKELVRLKAQLLYRKRDYRKALDAFKKTGDNAYTAMVYEHLNRSDSALIYYEKAIPDMKRLYKEKEEDIDLVYSIERNIALFYTFINQHESAEEYLTEIPESYDPELRELILHFDYYIENYVSGGYKDFLEGETVLFGTDSISNMNIDSLFTANRFYYNNYSSNENKYEYEIKKIFEQKAIKAGMNKLEKK